MSLGSHPRPQLGTWLTWSDLYDVGNGRPDRPFILRQVARRMNLLTEDAAGLHAAVPCHAKWTGILLNPFAFVVRLSCLVFCLRFFAESTFLKKNLPALFDVFRKLSSLSV